MFLQLILREVVILSALGSLSKTVFCVYYRLNVQSRLLKSVDACGCKKLTEVYLFSPNLRRMLFSNCALLQTLVSLLNINLLFPSERFWCVSSFNMWHGLSYVAMCLSAFLYHKIHSSFGLGKLFQRLTRVMHL